MSKSIRVLLVEDDENDRFFFIESVRRIPGVTIYDVARNGTEALEQLANATTMPDLIVTDINMPLMNGIEMLIEMKRHPLMKNIPLVFLSGDVDKAEQVRALGAQGFMTKPDNMLTLQAQLRKMMALDFVNDHDMPFQTFQLEH